MKLVVLAPFVEGDLRENKRRVLPQGVQVGTGLGVAVLKPLLQLTVEVRHGCARSGDHSECLYQVLFGDRTAHEARDWGHAVVLDVVTVACWLSALGASICVRHDTFSLRKLLKSPPRWFAKLDSQVHDAVDLPGLYIENDVECKEHASVFAIPGLAGVE